MPFKCIYQEMRKVDSRRAKLCNTRGCKKSKLKQIRKKVLETRAHTYEIEQTNQAIDRLIEKTAKREEETRDGAGGRAAGPGRPQAVGVGTCLSLVFLGTGLPGCPGLFLLSPPNY